MKDTATVKLTVAQISTKVQTDIQPAFDSRATLSSPTLTGIPPAPTAASGTNNAQLATTQFVQIAGDLHASADKATPVDADEVRIADGATSFGLKRLTFANLCAWGRAKILAFFNASGNAPVYACRTWVNFNGTGTVTIRSSGNVSSITDNGTGDYTLNFATALPDANYA